MNSLRNNRIKTRQRSRTQRRLILEPLEDRMLLSVAPMAQNDGCSVEENTTLSVLADGGVLANDMDVDGDTLSAVLATGPPHAPVPVLMHVARRWNLTVRSPIRPTPVFVAQTSSPTRPTMALQIPTSPR